MFAVFRMSVINAEVKKTLEMPRTMQKMITLFCFDPNYVIDCLAIAD